MKKEKKVVKEKKIDILKALYNIFIADPDSLGGEIPGLDAIYNDIKDNGSDDDKKIVEALIQSEKRIDDRLFIDSLKVVNSHKMRKLTEEEKERKEIREVKERSE